MLTYKTVLSAVLALAGAFAAPAQADDAVRAWTADPVAAFRAGATAYFAGDRDTARSALEAAAEGGHSIALWKLGQMYATGDGVPEDDGRAFDYFSAIADAHAEDRPGTAQARFVANAFVALGSYYASGINQRLSPDPERARELYRYAASYFGDADAQFHLGRMYLQGEGGERDVRQAARWLTLAARKGQVPAQLLLGEVLFLGEAPLRAHRSAGLMWLTVARSIALDGALRDRALSLHERYFALGTVDERARALQMAEEWLASPEGTALTARLELPPLR
ncbi:MAG: sel1 repeat family protein [Hyphomicrobiaceae bacterium]|nr:sel1 repeat family protein [Hyphomicrobiaceae bacterium]